MPSWRGKPATRKSPILPCLSHLHKSFSQLAHAGGQARATTPAETEADVHAPSNAVSIVSPTAAWQTLLSNDVPERVKVEANLIKQQQLPPMKQKVLQVLQDLNLLPICQLILCQTSTVLNMETIRDRAHGCCD